MFCLPFSKGISHYWKYVLMFSTDFSKWKCLFPSLAALGDATGFDSHVRVGMAEARAPDLRHNFQRGERPLTYPSKAISLPKFLDFLPFGRIILGAKKGLDYLLGRSFWWPGSEEIVPSTFTLGLILRLSLLQARHRASTAASCESWSMFQQLFDHGRNPKSLETQQTAVFCSVFSLLMQHG